MIQFYNPPPEYPPAVKVLVERLSAELGALTYPPWWDQLSPVQQAAWEATHEKVCDPIRETLILLARLYEPPPVMISGTQEEVDEWLAGVPRAKE